MTELLTMIVPAYNESSRFDKYYWIKMIEIPNTRYIFVDDGSTDDTYKILSNLTQNSKSTVLQLPKNSGKSEAIRFGINHHLTEKHQSSNGQRDLFGYIDADSAFNPEECSRIFNLANYYLVENEGTKFRSLWTSRVKLRGRSIHRSTARHFIGRIIHTIIGTFISDLPYDSQCGLKIFTYSGNTLKIFSEPFKTRWFVDLEILLRFQKLELKREQNSQEIDFVNSKYELIREEPLEFWKDVKDSKLSLKITPIVLREIIILYKLNREYATTK